jgi:hypothetical protein
MGEEHLRGDEAVRGKKFIVRGHEARLADGGARLFFREIGGTRGVTERAHAGTDRAGSHEHHFFAGFFQGGDLRDQLFQLRRINQLPAIGEDTGAEFDDKTGNRFERIAMHAEKLRKIPHVKKVKII